MRTDIWNINSDTKLNLINIDENSKEWARNIGNLYNIFINSIICKNLQKMLPNTPNNEKNLRSINLLKEIISSKELPVQKLNVLDKIKDIRNVCYAHHDTQKMNEQIDKAKEKFGSLKKHYEDIIIRLTDCLNFLLDNLNNLK
ncbi:MAG: hypothetical protein LBL71_00880 [Endomicrobium sp.]|jgi:flagellin-specific chaperone FliS|nr:hypothetical protein [Endomicrobium sp.]